MQKHHTKIDGYDGSLRLLARQVCSMRYDKVAEFFKYCAEEILLQADWDTQRKRHKLAALLRSAWGISKVLAEQYNKIFALCKPHMKDELASER